MRVLILRDDLFDAAYWLLREPPFEDVAERPLLRHLARQALKLGRLKLRAVGQWGLQVHILPAGAPRTAAKLPHPRPRAPLRDPRSTVVRATTTDIMRRPDSDSS